MTVALEEFTEWRHSVEARLGTLEAVSDNHVDKINNQRGSLDVIHADLGEMRGYFTRQQGMLQALHLTQNEQAARFRTFDSRLTGVENRLTSVEGRLTSVEGTLQKVHVGVDAILELLRSADSGGSESENS